MDTTLLISLRGHETPFRMDQEAHARLVRYLDAAEGSLRGDPDRIEVLGDLERSIGDRLLAFGGGPDRVIAGEAMTVVLDAVGAVGVPGPADARGSFRESPPAARPRRRLRRIRQGQEVAGVCTGIAAYSELDVEWVRMVFIFGSMVTAGILAVVYIALAVLLPISPTAADAP